MARACPLPLFSCCATVTATPNCPAKHRVLFPWHKTTSVQNISKRQNGLAADSKTWGHTLSPHISQPTAPFGFCPLRACRPRLGRPRRPATQPGVWPWRSPRPSTGAADLHGASIGRRSHAEKTGKTLDVWRHSIIERCMSDIFLLY